MVAGPSLTIGWRQHDAKRGGMGLLVWRERGDEIRITDEVVRAAAGNEENGKEVMTLLLDQRGDEVRITDEVVKAAAGNEGNGKKVMTILLEQRGYEITITDEVVLAAAGNWENGKEVMRAMSPAWIGGGWIRCLSFIHLDPGRFTVGDLSCPPSEAA
ncbi:hypothetical protein NLG97_g2896 [Lecanicillium saksenae]|uniref:Uncharacterized protein n=1 Tax=Lecanicillium saksenae TaxID=468837 RepID=A0ACC1R0V0_9HYPO|nr:hypothetical protein NLG97_g2896 [Lecanicillium saksenae]